MSAGRFVSSGIMQTRKLHKAISLLQDFLHLFKLMNYTEKDLKKLSHFSEFQSRDKYFWKKISAEKPQTNLSVLFHCQVSVYTPVFVMLQSSFLLLVWYIMTTHTTEVPTTQHTTAMITTPTVAHPSSSKDGAAF